MIFFRKVFIFCGSFFIFWWLFQKEVSAQIVLNEIYANPHADEKEWVELRNMGDQAVNLNGWQVWDQLSTPKIAFQFSETLFLDANAYLAVELTNALNNSGDEVILKDSQGQEQDRFSYTSAQKGKSWSRDSEGTWQEANPTREAPNNIPSTPSKPTAFPRLSEVAACPAGGEEWIELFNPHETEISLAGLSLRDDKNQIASFSQESIDSQSFFVVSLKNVLNNNGDSVFLLSSEKKVVDEMSYSDCDPSTSWAHDGRQWLTTLSITKNAPNLFSQPVEESLEKQPTASQSANMSQPSLPQQNHFVYPPQVLQPHLSHNLFSYAAEKNIAFGAPPSLERGAIGVIMGGLLLLVPGYVYAKNRSQPF